ncbi:MAM and LDL-receptor class A domain-containing protein 2-like [Lineus longissimus]|uniref:MAM and LDL-receptor class A domain-containing protein 2-like n=1 Tax=Lineus longissimus TaxID=88925 RepID=UPI00315C70B0
MGNRFLSYYDKMNVNFMYKCNDSCNDTSSCQNGGYQNKACGCTCPDGLGGDTCNTQDPTWTKNCGGIFSLGEHDSLTVETPGFGGNYTYSAGDRCAWVFKSKLIHYVVEFKLLSINNQLRDEARTKHCADTLELRTNLFGQTGKFICGSSPDVRNVSDPLLTVQSRVEGEDRFVSVLFKSQEDSKPTTGFKAIVSLREITACILLKTRCPGSSYCVDGGSQTDSKCVCNSGFSGVNCDTVATATISEDFENSAYSGVYFFDVDRQYGDTWFLLSGETQSFDTGPVGDHTTGHGTYAYFEASAPAVPGQLVSLTSTIIFDNSTRRCLSFAYSMNGANMGSLAVKLVIDGVEEVKPLFHAKGNKGLEWRTANLTIPKRTDNYKVRFVAERGDAFKSDIAIDDVMIISCPEPTTTSEPTTTTPEPTTTTPEPTTTMPESTTTTPEPTTTTPEPTTTTPEPTTTTPKPTTTTPEPTTTTPKPTTTTASKNETNLCECPKPKHRRMLTLAINAKNTKCLEFDYRIKVEGRKLQVALKTGVTFGPWNWLAVGDPSTKTWQHVAVPLTKIDKYQIVFDGVKHADRKGPVAIRDVVVHDGPCVKDVDQRT